MGTASYPKGRGYPRREPSDESAGEFDESE